MPDNPYVPPRTDPVQEEHSTHTPSDLRRIAALQKILIGCIWIYVAMLVSVLWADWAFVQTAWMSGGMAIAAVVIGAIAVGPVFLLVRQLNGGWRWLVLCPMTIVPPFGLFALLITNRVAVRTLRQHGVEVGWLGAWRSP